MHGATVDLQFYNVRTRQKEKFVPREEGKVGFYLCGLTVYDHMHIGHARTALGFEIIRRWLERSYDVTFVQNVTDVDDKIIARAVELGVSPLEHAHQWDEICRQQTDRLGVRAPDLAPHATTSMDGIVAFIEAIITRGFAYATNEGNVYFDVPGYDAHAATTFPDAGYGTLSHRNYKDMAAGTRKTVAGDKQHPSDFALWKRAKPEEPADARWKSPWGDGRPGWHIECSFMSTNALGEQIDIHGGGQDLIFPHHENEIAQSQAKTGKAPFVQTWIHSGFLNVDGTKMSKSLGNYLTLAGALDDLEKRGIPAEALRFYFAQTHYRSKIDFSQQGLDEAIVAWQRLQRTREQLAQRAASGSMGCADIDPPLLAEMAAQSEAFIAAMNDDIHTPGAMAALFAMQKACNQALDGLLGSHAAGQALEMLENLGSALTLFDTPVALVPADVATLAAQRQSAREAKDWDRADELRDAIQALGYAVQDSATGPRIEKL